MCTERHSVQVHFTVHTIAVRGVFKLALHVLWQKEDPGCLNGLGAGIHRQTWKAALYNDSSVLGIYILLQ